MRNEREGLPLESPLGPVSCRACFDHLRPGVLGGLCPLCVCRLIELQQLMQQLSSPRPPSVIQGDEPQQPVDTEFSLFVWHLPPDSLDAHRSNLGYSGDQSCSAVGIWTGGQQPPGGWAHVPAVLLVGWGGGLEQPGVALVSGTHLSKEPTCPPASFLQPRGLKGHGRGGIRDCNSSTQPFCPSHHTQTHTPGLQTAPAGRAGHTESPPC